MLYQNPQLNPEINGFGGSPKIHIIQPQQDQILFSYDLLPPDQASHLKTVSTRIHTKMELSHQLIAEMGADLIAVKEQMPGLFEAWCSYEFAQSMETLKNYMRVAARIPKLPKGSEHLIKRSTLYQAAKLTSSNEGVKAIIESLEKGQEVDYETGVILARSPEYVRAAFMENEMPKTKAYDLTKAYAKKNIPQEVKDKAQQWKVEDVAIIDKMAAAYERHQKTKLHASPSKTWITLVEEDGVMNGIEWTKHVSKASDIEWDRWLQDRQQIHIDENKAKDITFNLEGIIGLSNGLVTFEITNPPKDLIQYLGEKAKAQITIKGVNHYGTVNQ